MTSVIWATMLWGIVLILLPIERLRLIWPVGIISFILLFIIDFTFSNLGYYKFIGEAFAIGGIPLFYLAGGAAGGILLVNWLNRNVWSKIIAILLFSSLLVISEYIFLITGVFKHLHNFDLLISFTLNIAGLSMLVWLSFAVVGEEEIYNGNKGRFYV